MKLYDLATEFRDLAEQLEELELDQETMFNTLEGSTELMDLEAKAENIIHMIKNWEAEIPGLKSEIERLNKKKSAIENRIISLKNYLKTCLEVAGLNQLKVGTFNTKIQPNSRGSVKVENIELVPKEYLDLVPESYKPNNDRLHQDLKSGKEIPGVKYEIGNHLRIN